MKLLLTNDDGVFAPGIAALAQALATKHEVTIAAPSMERSGAGHSFTYGLPLRMDSVLLPGLPEIEAYAVTGTPVDCVKIAYGNLDRQFDMVVSGINRGANIGTDVFYSGTVAAALEGRLLGLPALAVSTASFMPQHFEAAARVALAELELMQQNGDKFINVNVPDLPFEQLKGRKRTCLCVQRYADRYVERLDTHMHKYYWVPAELLSCYEPGEDSDGRWIAEGYVSVTPLLSDLTDYSELAAGEGDKE